jgi:hypothetical protein
MNSSPAHVGEVSNKGIELHVGTIKSLIILVTGNFSNNKNELKV